MKAAHRLVFTAPLYGNKEIDNPDERSLINVEGKLQPEDCISVHVGRQVIADIRGG